MHVNATNDRRRLMRGLPRKWDGRVFKRIDLNNSHAFKVGSKSSVISDKCQLSDAETIAWASG